jgi:hypothetical protein
MLHFWRTLPAGYGARMLGHGGALQLFLPMEQLAGCGGSSTHAMNPAMSRPNFLTC